MGTFYRWLDFVPDFRNELRDTPLFLQAGAIITQCGRRVSPVNGFDLGRMEIDEEYLAAGTEWRLRLHRSLDCGEYGTLRAGTPGSAEAPEDNIAGFMPTRLFLEDRMGNVAWTLDFSDLPEVFHGPAFEYDAPYLFFPVAVPLSYTRDSAYDQPEFCAIWIVDIRSGKIVQRLPVSDKPLFHCVLQAVDSANMMISYCSASENTQTLLCFRRINSDTIP